MEPRDREAARGIRCRRKPRPTVSLVEWLEADGDELVARYDASTCRATTPASCAGTRSSPPGTSAAAELAAAERYAEGEDELLRDHAAWALARLDRRARRMKLIRILAYIRLALVPLAIAKVALARDDFPTSRYELAAWLVVAAQALLALILLWLAYRWRRRHRYLAALDLIAARGGCHRD